MNKEKTQKEVKEMLVERLMLRMKPEDIDNDAPLFTNPNRESELEDIGLDSVDALEIMVGVQQLYEIKLSPENSSTAFYSVNTLVDYIIQNKTELE